MAWTAEELDRIGAAEELEIITARADGTPRRPVPIWVVRVGDELYARSYRGADGSCVPGTSSSREAGSVPAGWRRT